MTKPERTVESYIASLEPHAAFAIERVREIVREIAPDFDETIKYEMAVFRYAGTYLYAGAWKKHLGLYPVFPADPALETEIAPFRSGKDTVQFKYAKPMPYELIEKIARARIGAG